MKLSKTGFRDLILICHKVNHDNRGTFKETFKKNMLESMIGYKINFCQENIVTSKLNVLRGLHYQKEPFAQSKLISIHEGEILDIAVDIRKNSITYGKYFSYVLSANNNESLYIPKGFAHGYLTLSDKALISYKVDNYYNSEMESGIMYNDNFLKINWGVDYSKIKISNKDKNQKTFKW